MISFFTTPILLFNFQSLLHLSITRTVMYTFVVLVGQSLALAHCDIDDGKVVFVPWVETDFRTGDAPWWA